MTCGSNVSRASREVIRPRPPKKEEECCASCNSQLCSSYLVGLLACLLVVGGIFLAFQRWDYMWLVVTAVGIVLVFVGAMLHYCGSHNQKTKEDSKRTSRLHLEVGQNEHLLSNAANLNGTFSVSQLSLNMLPPYFPSYDGISVSRPPGSISPITPSVLPGCGAISPIMQINGQSFLLLPIGGVTTNPDGSVAFDAQSLIASKLCGGSMLQVPQDSQTNGIQQAQQTRGFVLIKPQDFDIASGCQPSSTNIINDSIETPAKSVAQVQTSHTESEINPVPSSTDTLNSIVEASEDFTSEEEEPLYQVPRLIQTDIPVVGEASTEARYSPLPNNENFILNHVSETLENVQLCDILSDTENPSNSDVAIDISDNSVQLITLPDANEMARSTTPDLGDEEVSVCPPSYDEVAVGSATMRLGLPKFAYETM